MTPDDAGRELTARALIAGASIGAALAAGNVYLALEVGFTDGGTFTSLAIAFAALAWLPRRLAPLEANVIQTCATGAALMVISGGIVGPLAALRLAGHVVTPWAAALWGAGVATLGTLLAAPGRARAMALRFPSSVATAEMVRALFDRVSEARARIRSLGIGAAIGAAAAVLRDALGWIPAFVAAPGSVRGTALAGLGAGIAISPMLPALGALIGLAVTAAMALGALIAWIVLAPWLVEAKVVAGPDYGSVLGWVLWPGVALVVAAALTDLALDAPAIFRARERAQTARAGRRDTIAWLAGVALAIAAIVTGGLALGIPLVATLFGVLITLPASALAIRAAGETDNVPGAQVGGLTQITAGTTMSGGVAAPLGAGGVAQGAAVVAANMSSSWKVGVHLGASPRRLLIAQLAGVAAGVAGALLAFEILVAAHPLGGKELPAPGAQSWHATAEVVIGGIDALPRHAATAAAIAFVAGILLAAARRARFPVPSPYGLGIGFLLPLASVVPMLLGALAMAALARWRAQLADRHGLAVVSGVFAGESLAGLTIAALQVAGLLTVPV